MVMYLQRNNSCILPRYIRIVKLIPKKTPRGVGARSPHKKHDIALIAKYR
jgi:hypothetical protein